MFVWFLLLVLQNAAFTLVSRARNSDNIAYGLGASLLSNSVWFVVQAMMIGYVAKTNMGMPELAKLVAVYAVGCSLGGALMQWVSIKYLKKWEGK